jgi:hypothetical protein
VQVDLLPSSRGRFEVEADGTPLFEKSRLGRHAHDGEVAELLRMHRSRAPGAG